jgi:ornithine--oxo-acid transaminase
MLERFKPGLFAQLVVVPLFRDYRILSQVAGHGMAVIKGLPPLTVDDDDLAWIAGALDATISRAANVPLAFASFAAGAAGVRR